MHIDLRRAIHTLRKKNSVKSAEVAREGGAPAAGSP